MNRGILKVDFGMRYNDVTMKHINLFTAMLFLLLFVAGCSESDKETFEYGTTVITVRIADNVDTRTVVDENGNVSWSPTDRIGVFGSEGSVNIPFSLISENNETARFVGELAEKESPAVAYYPYIENAVLDGNTLKVEFPTEYEYTGNTYGPMLGTKNEDGSFAFNHLAAMMKLKINVPEEATALVITSDYWSPDVSGRFVVKDITIPDAFFEENNPFSSHELNVLIPSSMRGGVQTFYIPLPVSTYGKLTVALRNEMNKDIWYKSISNITLKRGVLLELPEVSSIEPMMVITSHKDGDILEGYGPIQTLTLKGYVDNFYSFNGSITLYTEEKREFIYDGYWNPVELPSGNLQGTWHYFETDVEIHRGKNVYTISMKGKDSAGNEIDDSYDIVLTYNENDEPAEAVDLGLSVKWASHNLGASKPEELGWGYVWADNTGTDVNHRDDYSFLIDYVKNEQGCPNISGIFDWDAATYKWGENWHIPTMNEVTELISNTECTIEQKDGVRGYRFTSKINGNSIFMPIYSSIEEQPQQRGFYWTGTRYADLSQIYNDRSCSFIYWYSRLVDETGERMTVETVYDSDVPGVSFWVNRCYIRPVCGD